MSLFTAGALLFGWVTQSQSKYGVRPEDAASAFRGTADSVSDPHLMLGYYWHAPVNRADNRGLGGGITWAWDDALCRGGGWLSSEQKDHFKGRGDYPSGRLEDQFSEDFFFFDFVTCISIRAAMHRAFQTWADVHPDISFIDVSEECRRLHGEVRSNCSIVEVFVTGRTNEGHGPTDGLPWPLGGTRYPYTRSPPPPSPPSEAPERRQLMEGQPPSSPQRGFVVCNGTACSYGPEQTEASLSSGTPAASAVQYARYATDLRSTNGQIQFDMPCTETPRADGFTAAECQPGTYPGPRQAIEAFGGLITFNVDFCWYLDSSFCGPLHRFKAQVGTNSAKAVIQSIAWMWFMLAVFLIILRVRKVLTHEGFTFSKSGARKSQIKAHRKQKWRILFEELESIGVLRTTFLLLSLALPIAIQVNIIAPCWECHDFEAAAVHEVGHILGLSHPNMISARDGYLLGSNSHNTRLASPDGIRPFDLLDQPSDLCSNPWDYVEAGPPDWSDDLTADGVRDSIMEALTEHNPKVCLKPDDMEGLNVLYPRCDGRGVAVSTEAEHNCYKMSTQFGWVRVLVYVFLPIAVILLLQLILLSRLRKYDEKVKRELKVSASEASRKASALESALEREKSDQERKATQTAVLYRHLVRRSARDGSHSRGLTSDRNSRSSSARKASLAPSCSRSCVATDAALEEASGSRLSNVRVNLPSRRVSLQTTCAPVPGAPPSPGKAPPSPGKTQGGLSSIASESAELNAASSESLGAAEGARPASFSEVGPSILPSSVPADCASHRA